MRNTNLTFEQELDVLLAETVEAAQRREASAFDELAGTNLKQIVLFGAGNLGRHTLTKLHQLGIQPLCFIDNNKARWGESVEGLTVLGPEEGAKLYGDSAVFVVVIWYGESADRMAQRIKQLRQLGCKCVVSFVPLYWKYANAFLPRYMVGLPHLVLVQADRVRKAFHLMADDTSRAEFIAQLRFRLLADFESMPGPVEGSIYFRDELFSWGAEECFVDCGAYTGDTLTLFLDKTKGNFNRVIAFEPDPENFVSLKNKIALLPADILSRIVLHEAATGSQNEQVLMDVGNGVASQVGAGDHKVDCLTLDSVLQDESVTMIKMDIEGSEVATLIGAQEVLRKNKPVLAISAYHRQDDLWNIPLHIKQAHPEYSFFLRPHLLEGWDLVCYAVPANRLK